MNSAAKQLHETIAVYNDAWNAHDVVRIGSIHAPDMVFEKHRPASGPRVRRRSRESWPDIEFDIRRLYVREGPVVQEWTARATHIKPLSRGEIVAEPSGKRIEWKGMDVIPF
jgi:SnoaL-like domain